MRFSLRSSSKMASSLIESTAKLSLTTDKRSQRIQIDGSILEGGGQSKSTPSPSPIALLPLTSKCPTFQRPKLIIVLRNASAYSCILRQPVQISNIRAGRPKPGLKQQHLSGLQLLAKISGGLLEGGTLGSREILLRPGKHGVLGDNFTCDQQGAGSTTLVFQSALPVLLFAEEDTTLLLRGGTDALTAAPPVYFTHLILLPFLKKHFGIECEIDIQKRGFTSFGGGQLGVRISALKNPLRCISLLERGEISSFTAEIWIARQQYETVSPCRYIR